MAPEPKPRGLLYPGALYIYPHPGPLRGLGRGLPPQVISIHRIPLVFSSYAIISGYSQLFDQKQRMRLYQGETVKKREKLRPPASSMLDTKERLHSQSDSRVNENQVHSQLDVSIPGAGNSSSSLESTAPQPILICQNSLTSIWNVSITKHEFLRMGKVLGNSIFHPMSRCRISFCVMGLIKTW